MKLGLPASWKCKFHQKTRTSNSTPIPEHPTPSPEPHLNSRFSCQDETGELPPETETWNSDNWDEEWLSSPWNNHKNWWRHEHAHEQRQDRQEGEAPGDPRHVIHKRGIDSLLHTTGLPPSWQVAWSKEADSSRTRGSQWWTDSGPRALSREGSRKRERTSNQRARARSRTTTRDNYNYDYFWIRNHRLGTTPERLTEDSWILTCGTVFSYCTNMLFAFHAISYIMLSCFPC